MAGSYQQAQGGGIGTLLRLIQEEKAANPLNAIPAADPNSPIRAQVQGPLLAPEAPGGTRNVSLRPEGIGSLGPSMEAQSGKVVGPSIPVAPVAGPSVAGPALSGGGGISPAPAAPRPTPAPTPTPSIGTKILGTSTKGYTTTKYAPYVQSKTPTRGNQPGSIGGATQKKGVPLPTPTPVNTKNAPKGAKSNYIRYTA